MAYEELIVSLQSVGKDPTRLIFEDELTGIYNRRFFLQYLETKIPWDTLEQHPASLVIMDVDKFKDINDAHGHLSGDDALVHVAKLLKEATGEAGLPIRYAGDEFMILLPDTDKNGAVQVAERILQRCATEQLSLRDGSTALQLKVSIGVASVPEDAQDGKDLVQKADAALYYAKRAGGNRLANTADISAHDVPEKAVLQKLQHPHVVGREEQLAQIADALEGFSRGSNQFLVVEGAAGMGKTTFLEAVRQAVSREEFQVVQVHGVRQEGYRPYYLATNILLALLNQRPDRGEDIFGGLSVDEITCLAEILPQFQGQVTGPSQEDKETKREGIFATFVDVIPKFVDFKPLVILIDDLQFVDAATLLLLRLLIQRKEVPVFICGTALESLSLSGEQEQVPLE